MAAGLPDLTARVRLDTSDLDAGVKRGAAFGSAIGSALGGIASGGLQAAVSGLRSFATGSVDAFAAVEDATGAAGVQFGSALPSVLAFADKASAGFGLSKRAALDAQNSFGTLGKAAGLQGEPLAAFSGKLTGLAGDLASFKGTSTEQAIEAVGAALRGETEPIRAYGVLLDDATLRAEAVTLGLIKTVKDGLTPQQKALAAQSAILKQTTDAQGDYARTSSSTANVQKTLAAETENAQAALGQKLAPAVTAVRGGILQLVKGATGLVDTIGRIVTAVQPAVQAFSAGMLPALQGVVPQLQALKDAIPEQVLRALGVVLGVVAAAIVVQTVATAAASLATAAWSLVTGPFVAVKNAEGVVIARGTIARLAHNIATVAGTVATAAGTVATTVATAAVAAFGVALRIAGGPVLLLISGLVLLVAGLVTAYKTSDTFRAVVDNAFRAVKDVVTTVLGAVSAFITGTWSAIKTTFTTALAVVQAAVVLYFTAYETVITTVLGAIKAVVTTILTAVGAVFTAALAAISAAVTAGLNVVRAIFTATLAAVSAVVTTSLNAVRAIFGAVLGAVVAVVTGFLGNVQQGFVIVLGAVRAVVQAGLSAVQAVFSTVFGGIRGVVQAGLSAAQAAVSGALAAIRGVITGGLAAVDDLFGGAFRAAAGAVSGGVGAIIGVVRGIPGAVLGALGNLGGLLSGAGRQLMEGLARGVADAGRRVVEAALAIVQKVKDLLPGSPIKAGPLRAAGWNSGRPGKLLMGNLAGGIDAGADEVQRSLARAVDMALPDVTAAVNATGVRALTGGPRGAGGPGAGTTAGATYNLQLTGVDLSRDPGDTVVGALRRMELLTA